MVTGTRKWVSSIIAVFFAYGLGMAAAEAHGVAQSKSSCNQEIKQLQNVWRIYDEGGLGSPSEWQQAGVVISILQWQAPDLFWVQGQVGGEIKGRLFIGVCSHSDYDDVKGDFVLFLRESGGEVESGTTLCLQYTEHKAENQWCEIRFSDPVKLAQCKSVYEDIGKAPILAVGRLGDGSICPIDEAGRVLAPRNPGHAHGGNTSI